MKTKLIVLLATACGAFLLGGGVVLAEPVPPGPSGFSAKIIADGTIARSNHIVANGIEYVQPTNARTLVQIVTFEAGGNSGWHTHPGLTVVTVTDGTLRVTVGCDAPEFYTAGQSFVEPAMAPGEVVNVSSTLPAHSVATLVVPHGMAPRVNVFAPICTHSG